VTPGSDHARLTRRMAICVGLAVVAGAFVPADASQPAAVEDNFDWTAHTSKDGKVKVRVGRGYGPSAVVIEGKNAGVLVDTCPAPWAASLKREAERGLGPIVLVINTHHHPDSSGGDHEFLRTAMVLSHAKAKPRIEKQLHSCMSFIKQALAGQNSGLRKPTKEGLQDAMRLYQRFPSMKPSDIAPTDVMEAEYEISMVGIKAALRLIGPAHTDNDVCVRLPDSDVLITGDVVCRGEHPEFDPDGGMSLDGWLGALDTLEAMCTKDTLVIPGRGAPGGRELIAAQRGYITDIRAEVAAFRAGGGTRRQEAMKLPLKKHAFANAEQGRQNLGVVFDLDKPR
jgi:glyoxylase-like metal-dependent hydrolase (beta-lactamase superfamily II)